MTSLRLTAAAITKSPSLFPDCLLQERSSFEWNGQHMHLQMFEVFLPLVCSESPRQLQHDSVELQELSFCSKRLALLFGPRLRSAVARPLVVPVTGLEHRDEWPAEEHQRIQAEEPARLDRETTVRVGEDFLRVAVLLARASEAPDVPRPPGQHDHAFEGLLRPAVDDLRLPRPGRLGAR